MHVPYSRTLALVVALSGSVTPSRALAQRATMIPGAPSAADYLWLAREPTVCGEVRGQVLDEHGDLPMTDVYITIDSVAGALHTEKLPPTTPPDDPPLVIADSVRALFLKAGRAAVDSGLAAARDTAPACVYFANGSA